MAVKSLCVAVPLVLCSLTGAACSRPVSSPVDHAKVTSASAHSTKSSPDDHLLRTSFSDCSDKSGGVTSAMQSCMEREYQYQNARLQSAYATLLQSQDVRSRRDTERLQSEWLAKKDSKCAWDAVHGGQAQRLEAAYCNMQSTAQRAVELEQRLPHQVTDML